ncbi:MAG: RNase J family beta-CASP ribonuclease [Clostridia bacterium]|nr:RNase J family beta-CASP ribonuclease [Clostridia bacterium]
MSENNQNKKRNGGQSRSQKETKSLKFKGSREPADFRIGSRDILSTPEILSPFGFEEETAKPKRGRKESPKPPTEEKPAAPTHNRKSKKNTEEPAPAEKQVKSNRTKTGGKSTEKKPSVTDPSGAKSRKKAAELPAETKPASKPASGRSRRGGPSIVSAEDSIVVAADTVAVTSAPSPRKTSAAALQRIPGAKLRVIPLGGLNEVGKNMTVVEYGDDIIIIDCGIGFPDEDEMPGIDLVIPDVAYLEQNRDRIRGMVITHGHEDHIGAIPYILQKLDVPVYATRLALGIIENKLQEHTLPWKADLRCVSAGDTIRLGASFTVEFIRVNHSIADACALAINTPLGMMIHSGDFKLDLTPIDGDMMDITRLGELGRNGVLLLLCESTNAERPGYTPSETKVGKSLEVIFTMHPDRRIVISTFSSNVHRVQQIINISARHGRKVAVTGRSMINIVSAAVELGYMKVPEGVLIDIGDIKRYKPEELTLITTGSQGEPMSALYRMAFGEHSQVTLGYGDLVVLSASAIPGNEKLVGRIINELSKMGVTVINDASVEVHVSGHACQEELKLMQGLTRPKYFMPVHGEYKHMAANRDLAVAMGIPHENVFISDIGKVLEIDEKGARWGGTVPAGVVLIDGLGVGDVGNIVLRDRKHLSQDGLIVVVATVDAASGLRVAGPDIVSRGFVYVRESEELMEEVRRIAVDAIDISLRRSGLDWFELKTGLKDDITKFIYARTKRKPMVLPIIMDV